MGSGESNSEHRSELVLSASEVRRVVRLLAEALAPEDGRAAKCGRLMDGLCQMIDADGWIWTRSRIASTGEPHNVDFLYGGDVGHQAMAVFGERAFEIEGVPPEHALLNQLLAHGQHFTRSRPQLVPDSEWNQPLTRAFVARFGFDELAYSIVPMAGDEVGRFISGGLLLRRPGRRPFEERECALFHLVFSEVGPLHADGLRVNVADDVATLTPRQRSILAQLIDGRSVPEIADLLSLSPHTVKGYVKELYRHLGVSSRAELLRRFMSGT